MITKSGIMTGLGETGDEIIETMNDLRAANCHIFTMGQYLRPSLAHLPVTDFMHPDTFAHYKRVALDKGFLAAECGPLVRSSYHAEEALKKIQK